MARICTMAEREAKRTLRLSGTNIPDSSAEFDRQNADAIHDLRVACRRARVALAEFGDQFAPGPRREARNDFRETRKRLGALRELDVDIELLRKFADGEHAAAAVYAADRLAAERETAARELDAHANELDPARLDARIDALLSNYRPTPDCHRKHAERRLKKRLKKLNRRYGTWCSTLRFDDLHTLRIQFKKLRYTLEVYTGLYGRHAQKLLDDIKSAQDVLGKWNDHRELRNHLAAMGVDATPEVQDGLVKLIDAVESRTLALIEEVKSELARFFERDRIQAMKKLFGKPVRACCDK